MLDVTERPLFSLLGSLKTESLEVPDSAQFFRGKGESDRTTTSPPGSNVVAHVSSSSSTSEGSSIACDPSKESKSGNDIVVTAENSISSVRNQLSQERDRLNLIQRELEMVKDLKERSVNEIQGRIKRLELIDAALVANLESVRHEVGIVDSLLHYLTANGLAERQETLTQKD